MWTNDEGACDLKPNKFMIEWIIDLHLGSLSADAIAWRLFRACITLTEHFNRSISEFFRSYRKNCFDRQEVLGHRRERRSAATERRRHSGFQRNGRRQRMASVALNNRPSGPPVISISQDGIVHRLTVPGKSTFLAMPCIVTRLSNSRGI